MAARDVSFPWAGMLLWVCSVCQAAFGLDATNVVVLYNAASSDGAQIASYYTQVHPGARTLAINNLPVGEDVSWNTYLDVIRPQVLAGIDSSTDVLVTTKGLPLRIDNPNPDPNSTIYWSPYSSLESELTRVDAINTQSLMGNQSWDRSASSGGNPLAKNPYYYRNESFDHDASLYNTMRLTARLDGFTVSDVIGSINRAQNAFYGWPGCGFLIDNDPSAPAATVNRMSSLVSTVLAPRGLTYSYDQTSTFVRKPPWTGEVIGYVSNGVYGGAPGDYMSNTQTGLTFTPASGAVMNTWESFNAWTFDKSKIDQMPVRQGLIAEWIARGGTAGTGHVQEPGVSVYNTTNEDRMFSMLLSGYTFAEAAWSATKQLSYVNTVVGDPLMRFRPWLPGDYTMDGKVDFVDYLVLERYYGSTSATALTGDGDGDGKVGFNDFQVLAAHFGQSVPEPPSISLLLLGALGLHSHKRLSAH